ncbi:MAG: hypothetical protein RI935_306 [Candidatus Parcubacteria bacterium]|jgi:hypothetical protein
MDSISANEHKIMISKKTERLVSALYLVINLVEEKEPIKHAIKMNAVTLLANVANLNQRDLKDINKFVQESSKTIEEILSLITVALNTGLVSEMNATLLRNHFVKLQSAIQKRQFTVHEHSLMIDDENKLDSEIEKKKVSESPSLSLAQRLHYLEESKEASARTGEQIERERLLRSLERDKKPPIKDNNMSLMNKTKISPSSTQSTHTFLFKESYAKDKLSSSFQMKKTSRRDQILALFVKGVDVSIKDIASKIRGCSEKTIQRELNTLVYDNVIERIGEKRWSRYILR